MSRFRPVQVPKVALDMKAYLQFILDSIEDPEVVLEFYREEFGEFDPLGTFDLSGPKTGR